MRTLLATAIALWVGLLPLVCISGLYTHLCTDCVEGVACDHEEVCSDDPCATQVLRPAPVTAGPVTGPGLAAGHWLRAVDLRWPRMDHLPGRQASGSPPADLYSFDRSLPLLI